MSEPVSAAIKPAELARVASISLPYASQILGNKRTPALGMSVRIFKRTGLKFGPLANLSDREARALAKMDLGAPE